MLKEHDDNGVFNQKENKNNWFAVEREQRVQGRN